MRRRIFAIATDSAGCYLYRLHWPLTHLNPDEFEVVIGGPPVELVERQVGDVVVGQRIAGNQPAWLDLCADPRILAVYEIDDDIIDVDPANQIPYSIFQPQREGTIRNIAAADVVTCSTSALAEKVRWWNPRAVVLPNCLPAEWFGEPRRHVYGGAVTIGWAGSMFHQQDWPTVRPQLAQFARRQPRARFATIGADYMSGAVQVSRSQGWGTMTDLLRTLDFDIGIAPLVPSEFNRSKSHAKLLEYGARGIPAVATAWGEYPAWVWRREGYSHPPALLVHNDPEQWVKHLEWLCDDDHRAATAAAARLRAKDYQIADHAWRWADVYRLTAEEWRA